MYIQNLAFEYTASSSALSSRMVATSLAKSPPSLMKFLRSSKPVFPFFEVVLWSKSPLERLLGIIELILDITSLAPRHHFSLGLIWIRVFWQRSFFVTMEILFVSPRKSWIYTRGNTVPLSVSNMVGGAADKSSSRAVGVAMRDCGGCGRDFCKLGDLKLHEATTRKRRRKMSQGIEK